MFGKVFKPRRGCLKTLDNGCKRMETGGTGHVEYIKYGERPNRLKVIEMTCNLLLVGMCRKSKLLNLFPSNFSLNFTIY